MASRRPSDRTVAQPSAESPASGVPQGAPDLPTVADPSLAPRPREVTAALARSAFAEEDADGIDLGGNPLLLDLLDDLDPMDPERSALRVKVEFLPPGRGPRIVPGDWCADLPTATRLAALVEAGDLPAGDYRILLRMGRRAAPYIRVSVADPVRRAPAEPASGGLAQALALLASAGVLPARASLPAGAPPDDLAERLARQEERAEALARDVERLAAATQELQAQAVHVLKALQGGESAGGPWEDTIRRIVERLLVERDAPTAPAAPPVNGAGNPARRWQGV